MPVTPFLSSMSSKQMCSLFLFFCCKSCDLCFKSCNFLCCSVSFSFLSVSFSLLSVSFSLLVEEISCCSGKSHAFILRSLSLGSLGSTLAIEPNYYY